MKKFSKYQLHIFFVLAFAFTWVLQILGYYFANKSGIKISNEENFKHFLEILQGDLKGQGAYAYVLFSLAAGPTISGILVTAIFKGRLGIKDLFMRAVKINVKIRWYFAVVLIPLIINLISLAIGFASMGFKGLEINPIVSVTLAVPFFFYMIFFTALAEEFGWRGYALPELQKKYNAFQASWILGVIWGLWHLPSNIIPVYLKGELNVPFVISISLGLAFGTVGWTLVNTWIYNNTESLFLIILLHGLSNTFQSYLLLSSNSMTAQIVFAFLPWIFAIYLLKKYGKEKLVYNPSNASQKQNYKG